MTAHRVLYFDRDYVTTVFFDIMVLVVRLIEMRILHGQTDALII